MFHLHTSIINNRKARSCVSTLKCLSLAATTLLFTACATSPDRSEPPAIDLPTAWSSQSFNTAPTAWLADFKSPQLEALVLEALAQNPSLKATAARFAQSVAEARISGADLKPSLGLGLNGARQKINTFGPNPTGGVIFENYDLALDLRWEIDLWGRLRDQTSAAVARVEGYQADLDAARLSLAAQTTKSWLNLIEAQQQLALAEHTTEAYRYNQRALESRFKLGLTEGFDWTRALAVWSVVKTGERFPVEVLTKKMLTLAIEGHIQRKEFDKALDMAERANGLRGRLEIARDIMHRQNRLCDQHGLLRNSLYQPQFLWDFE